MSLILKYTVNGKEEVWPIDATDPLGCEWMYSMHSIAMRNNHASKIIAIIPDGTEYDVTTMDGDAKLQREYFDKLIGSSIRYC